MRYLFATQDVNGRLLYFTLADYEDPNDKGVDLEVTTDHFSRDRKQIENLTFPGVETAKKHCHDKYGVSPNSWGAPPKFRVKFELEYTVPSWSEPYPALEGFEDGKIIIHQGKVEDATGGTHSVVNICGNETGLKKLAALILLCAESKRLCDHHHVHLQDRDDVATNVAVTLRSPDYFEANWDEWKEIRLM